MTWIIGLLIGCMVLVFLEVLLPGGILGLLAAACLIGATIKTAALYGGFAAALVFMGAILLGLVMVVLEFKLFAKTRFGKRFFLTRTVGSGNGVEVNSDALIGAEGVALTRLNPAGKVEVNGKSYDAHCRDGYLESGTPIQIISKDSFKLIIKKL